jgi:hypothetical protein
MDAVPDRQQARAGAYGTEIVRKHEVSPMIKDSGEAANDEYCEEAWTKNESEYFGKTIHWSYRIEKKSSDPPPILAAEDKSLSGWIG